MRDNIDSWEKKWLNYAGRVQLATSVLLSFRSIGVLFFTAHFGDKTGGKIDPKFHLGRSRCSER